MSNTQYFNSEVKILSQIPESLKSSKVKPESQIVLSEFESKVFTSKTDAFNFIKTFSFFNEDNDCSYSIAGSNHTPKRFLGQYFVAVILIENPGQIDCQNLHVHFIYENDKNSGSLEFLRNFKIPYLMKKACLVFPLCIYLTQQSYKLETRISYTDVRSELSNQIYKKPYSLSPRLPFKFEHSILDHDEQSIEQCLSNVTIQNITGVKLIRNKSSSPKCFLRSIGKLLF